MREKYRVDPAPGWLYLEHVVSETVLQADPKNPDGRLLKIVRCGLPYVNDRGIEEPLRYSVGQVVLLSPKSAVQLPRGYVASQDAVMCVLDPSEEFDEMSGRPVPLIAKVNESEARQIVADAQRGGKLKVQG